MATTCVQFFEAAVDWQTAQQNCVALGGTLAVPSNRDEHDVLTTLWNNQYTWIGVSDAESERQWTTVDGAAIPFAKWCPNQPDNGANEDCMHLRSGYGSSDGPCYNDGVCALEMNYFCAVDASVLQPALPAAPVSTECEACTPGFFSVNGTTCEPCAPGSISTHYNATGCEECYATSTSFRGTSSCFDTAAHLAATGCVCGL